MNDREPPPLLLAPLRGVTIRCFRETFAGAVRDAGFTEAVTPFITANAGVDPVKDRELRGGPADGIRVTPQFIGKDPAALRFCLERIRSAGWETADLNCGCPFPMVRNKGRGSGLLRTPDVLRRMLDVGCETMGPGRFSVKARIGVDSRDELLGLMPILNDYPLRFLVVHARTARQMYEGECDLEMAELVESVAKMPVVRNGDIGLPPPEGVRGAMVGRAFIRSLASREDVAELMDRYVAASLAELKSERPVLGRMKELLSYWAELPGWRRRWKVAKMARSLQELRVWPRL